MRTQILFTEADNRAYQVRQVQDNLKVLKKTHPSIGFVPQNGLYDSQTKDAVRSYQSAEGLKSTGIVDFETYDKLQNQAEIARQIRSDTCVCRSASFPMKIGDQSEDVEYLHALLAKENKKFPRAPHVPITDTYSKDTEKCVKYYQKIHGLEQTGRADGELLSLLVHDNKSTATD